MVDGRFCGGVLRIPVAKRGVLDGRSWWIRGESVAGNASKSIHENMPTFAYFFQFPATISV
jgi:hypothetical protein